MEVVATCLWITLSSKGSGKNVEFGSLAVELWHRNAYGDATRRAVQGVTFEDVISWLDQERNQSDYSYTTNGRYSKRTSEKLLRTQLTIAPSFFSKLIQIVNQIWNFMFEGGGKHNSKIEILSF